MKKLDVNKDVENNYEQNSKIQIRTPIRSFSQKKLHIVAYN